MIQAAKLFFLCIRHDDTHAVGYITRYWSFNCFLISFNNTSSHMVVPARCNTANLNKLMIILLWWCCCWCCSLSSTYQLGLDACTGWMLFVACNRPTKRDGLRPTESTTTIDRYVRDPRMLCDVIYRQSESVSWYWISVADNFILFFFVSVWNFFL